MIGSTVEEGEDQQGDGAVGGDSHYQVIGTLSDPQKEKPDWVQEVVQVRRYSALFLRSTCTVYIVITQTHLRFTCKMIYFQFY